MRLLFSILIIIVVISPLVAYADAPPPPPPPRDIVDPGRLYNITNIINWYYREWWGPLSWAVVFLVPVSIFIKSRSISLAAASLIILMSLLSAAASEEPFVRYIALVGISFAAAVILYRVLYNPEKQPQEL